MCRQSRHILEPHRKRRLSDRTPFLRAGYALLGC
jgi:hypothetical protein